jgi:hypothetical protein
MTEMPVDRNDELAKRASIFGVSDSIATMFSGYLMSAVINLNGRNGLKGCNGKSTLLVFGYVNEMKS